MIADDFEMQDFILNICGAEWTYSKQPKSAIFGEYAMRFKLLSNVRAPNNNYMCWTLELSLLTMRNYELIIIYLFIYYYGVYAFQQVDPNWALTDWLTDCINVKQYFNQFFA